MSNLEKYRMFSESEKSIPLFSKGWWMDAVCEDNWDVILLENADVIIASLPYYFQEMNHWIEIKKAILTQTNGIWINYPQNQKYEKRLSFENRVMNYIIDEIEKLPITQYQQYFHFTIENWLPFYWRGYSQTTRYTYVIEDTSNLQQIYENFNSNLRKSIRKAEKQVTVKEDISIDEFYCFNKMTFKRQGLDIPYSIEIVSRIDEACNKRDARKTFYCVDENNQIHSAIYFVWDDDTVYYLMSGSHPDYRNTQSLSLLMFEGIKLAHQLNKKFNFEGSMKKNIEHHFRQFGAIQKAYHHIFKTF